MKRSAVIEKSLISREAILNKLLSIRREIFRSAFLCVCGLRAPFSMRVVLVMMPLFVCSFSTLIIWRFVALCCVVVSCVVSYVASVMRRVCGDVFSKHIWPCCGLFVCVCLCLSVIVCVFLFVCLSRLCVLVVVGGGGSRCELESVSVPLLTTKKRRATAAAENKAKSSKSKATAKSKSKSKAKKAKKAKSSKR